MTDRYAVIGHPVAHSKSPWIHAAFAQQTAQQLDYSPVLGALEDFEAQVRGLAAAGLRGCNITLPFKQRALALADRASPRARLAGAANTLTCGADGISADNTDGIGLMRDLREHLGLELTGSRVLVLGAGGAVRGILAPLLALQPACVHLLNRSPDRAHTLLEQFAALASTPGVLDVLASPPALLAASASAPAPGGAYDLVINGTSASLSGALPVVPARAFGPHTTAYDLAYRSAGDTPFMALARDAGAVRVRDGLGMLVEQAAESFAIWRGVRPSTPPVLQALRAELAATQ